MIFKYRILLLCSLAVEDEEIEVEEEVIKEKL